MSESGPAPTPDRSVLARIGLDWWAVLFAAVIVILVITGLVSKISW
ncbi:hypothetical protein [Nocardia stercoris]|nr:hypothetical protein [Nocardia stercoris]